MRLAQRHEVRGSVGAATSKRGDVVDLKVLDLGAAPAVLDVRASVAVAVENSGSGHLPSPPSLPAVCGTPAPRREPAAYEALAHRGLQPPEKLDRLRALLSGF